MVINSRGLVGQHSCHFLGFLEKTQKKGLNQYAIDETCKRIAKYGPKKDLLYVNLSLKVFLSLNVLKKARKSLKKLKGEDFFCEEDALKKAR